MPEQTSKKYTSGARRRQCFLERAWEAAELTLPFILPRNGDQDSDLPTPYQSIGARGVNSLSSKFLLTLFPPNSPFMKFQIDDFMLEELNAQRAPVEEGLSSMERAISNEVDAKAMRVPLNEVLRHLVITGNCVVYVNPENKLRVFHLDQFCVRRDPQGEVLEIIVKEEMSRELYRDVFGSNPPKDSGDSSEGTEKPLDLYTVVRRKDKKIHVHQEVNNQKIPKTDSKFPVEKSPWLALRYNAIDGEDYGRGFVEEYLGDLQAAESLNRSILEGTAAAAKVIFLVKPNGTTKMKSVVAANLSVRQGNPDDVGVIQIEKFNDFRVARETLEAIERRLSSAFLLLEGVQRDAERVTAEEIRVMAQEIDTSKGGVYTLLSHELQLPLVKRIQASLERQKKLPKLPEGTVEPVIITGFEALGRGNDANKMATFVQTLTNTLGPEATAQYINISDFAKRLGVGFGIDMKGLVKSQDEVQQEQQQAAQQQQQAEILKAATPNAVTQGGEAIRENQQNVQQ